MRQLTISLNTYRLNTLNIRRLLNSSSPTVTEAISHSALSITCDSVMDNRVAVLCHKAKEHLAPRIIKIMKDLVAKFL